ncbi:uncharacterized protein LOC108672230 isoform X2 [Hyalella azteca]|uniref:Uncharacterized protein LOC108672230 isoform X2 n=1 Tax=Hyalella azteca TaxID=294128 RepID=A0A8B7NNS8_HYAAZ|nr:uncharacterized protein LOC108672230 isoform X2 [Hyalella azteca]
MRHRWLLAAVGLVVALAGATFASSGDTNFAPGNSRARNLPDINSLNDNIANIEHKHQNRNTTGGSSIVRRRRGSKVRSKRDNQSTSSAESGTKNRLARLIQYSGWNPVDLSNPLNNQPTVSYKPPSLQKVHFGKDPPPKKPLYPIVPENPPVYVLRENKKEPELDEVYGTEKIEYVHIEPKSKTISAFKPVGNARVVKLVKRLDNIQGSDLIKRSPASPLDLINLSNNGPNYDVTNFQFPNVFDNFTVDLDSAFSENNQEVVIPSPLLRLLPRKASAPERQLEASGRAMLPTNITPQQLLQARLSLARLPFLSSLQGLFGSFTQIPLEVHSKRSGLPAGDSVIEEIVPPNMTEGSRDQVESSASAPIGTVIFARSRQKIDREDLEDYFDKNDENDRTLIGKSPSRNLPNKGENSSKTLAANSLSELLQIFRHINVTEPPPTPTTTPPPVTIMKGFRYTKPTEAPMTTTTTRPTTTKRFRLPTAVRYLMGKPKKKSHAENFPSTTATPLTTLKSVFPARIIIAPTLTPHASKPSSGVPDRIFDNVAETNSLDGYLFSDSEPSPKYIRTNDKPAVTQKAVAAPLKSVPSIVIPKALSSDRDSVKLIGASRPVNEIVHTKNSEPLKSEFEIIYTKSAETTTTKPAIKDDSPFTIIEGHSKVRIFRSDSSRSSQNMTVSLAPDAKLSTQASVDVTPNTPLPNTSISSSTDSNTSGTVASHVENGLNDSVTAEVHDYDEPDFESYDYFKDKDSFLHVALEEYDDFPTDDVPSYTLKRPLASSDGSTNASYLSFFDLSDQNSNLSHRKSTHRNELPTHPPPPFHFIEGLRQSLPTSVPTTWQDLDLSASDVHPIFITAPPRNESYDGIQQEKLHEQRELSIISMSDAQSSHANLQHEEDVTTHNTDQKTQEGSLVQQEVSATGTAPRTQEGSLDQQEVSASSTGPRTQDGLLDQEEVEMSNAVELTQEGSIDQDEVESSNTAPWMQEGSLYHEEMKVSNAALRTQEGSLDQDEVIENKLPENSKKAADVDLIDFQEKETRTDGNEFGDHEASLKAILESIVTEPFESRPS